MREIVLLLLCSSAALWAQASQTEAPTVPAPAATRQVKPFIPPPQPKQAAAPSRGLLAQKGDITVTDYDAGSVVTEMVPGVKMNEGSSLHRKAFLINDATSPVEIGRASVMTSFVRPTESYRYTPLVVLNAQQPITAFELRMMLFDVFGQRMVTLSSVRIGDATGVINSVDWSSYWRANENEIQKLLMTVAFVAKVRRADGTVWSYDPQALVDAMERIQLSVAVADLSSDKVQ